MVFEEARARASVKYVLGSSVFAVMLFTPARHALLLMAKGAHARRMAAGGEECVLTTRVGFVFMVSPVGRMRASQLLSSCTHHNRLAVRVQP